MLLSNYRAQRNIYIYPEFIKGDQREYRWATRGMEGKWFLFHLPELHVSVKSDLCGILVNGGDFPHGLYLREERGSNLENEIYNILGPCSKSEKSPEKI